MKLLKQLKLIALFLIGTNLFAQVTTEPIHDNLDFLYDTNDSEISMLATEGFVLISDSYFHRITKIDISSVNQTPQIIFDDAIHINKMQLIGDELYFSQMSDETFSPNSGKIWKININDTNPEKVLVADHLGAVDSFIISENNLFIAEIIYRESTGEIDHTNFIRINIDNQSVHQIIKEFPAIEDLKTDNEFVYIYNYSTIDETSFVEDPEIWKYNIANGEQTRIYKTESIESFNMGLSDHNIFFGSDWEEDYYLEYISKNSINANPIKVIKNPIVYQGNECYVHSVEAVKNDTLIILIYTSTDQDFPSELYYLFKVKINGLSTDDRNSSDSNIYPNPVKKNLYVKGIKSLNEFSINDLTGKTYIEGRLTEKNSINVSQLTPGIYILTIGNQKMKFIKE